MRATVHTFDRQLLVTRSRLLYPFFSHLNKETSEHTAQFQQATLQERVQDAVFAPARTLDNPDVDQLLERAVGVAAMHASGQRLPGGDPPRQLQPRAPRDLETICLKCLQKEPARRYGSALALAEDLRRFLAGEPIEARPVGRSERLWRWSCRNPVVAALSAGLCLLLLAGTGTSTFFAVEAAQRESQANANADRAAQSARELLGLLSHDAEPLSSPPPARSAMGRG